MTGTCSTGGNLKHSILEHTVPETSSDACLVPKRDQTTSLFTEKKSHQKQGILWYPINVSMHKEKQHHLNMWVLCIVCCPSLVRCTAWIGLCKFWSGSELQPGHIVQDMGSSQTTDPTLLEFPAVCLSVKSWGSKLGLCLKPWLTFC